MVSMKSFLVKEVYEPCIAQSNRLEVDHQHSSRVLSVLSMRGLCFLSALGLTSCWVL